MNKTENSRHPRLSPSPRLRRTGRGDDDSLCAFQLPRVIASMTSFPAAIKYAADAVRSILRGRKLPDKIVVYLTESQWTNGIPKELSDIKSELLEVRFWKENIRSYTKLVPALHDFPNDIIITFDDDIEYSRSMIARLLRAHKRYPNAIIANVTRPVGITESGDVLPYKEWKRNRGLYAFTHSSRPSFRNLVLGYSGMLYPPRVFDKTVLDSKIFMELAPSTDDIWFWAMAVKNGTRIKPVWLGAFTYKNRYLGKPDAIGLLSENIIKMDKNKIATENILRRFPEILEKLN